MTAGYASDLVSESRHPSGAGTLEGDHRQARAANRMCGDETEIHVRDENGSIVAVAHRTRGCAFTVASASILARTIPGLTIAEALDLAARLERDLAGGAPLPAPLAALASVRVYPARTRCALLPWEALRSAFDTAA